MAARSAASAHKIAGRSSNCKDSSALSSIGTTSTPAQVRTRVSFRRWSLLRSNSKIRVGIMDLSSASSHNHSKRYFAKQRIYAKILSTQESRSARPLEGRQESECPQVPPAFVVMPAHARPRGTHHVYARPRNSYRIHAARMGHAHVGSGSGWNNAASPPSFAKGPAVAPRGPHSSSAIVARDGASVEAIPSSCSKSRRHVETANTQRNLADQSR